MDQRYELEKLGLFGSRGTEFAVGAFENEVWDWEQIIESRRSRSGRELDAYAAA
jgi:hypothetical protein